LNSLTFPTASILSFAIMLASAAYGSMPSEFKCNGNEPFWGLAIDSENAGWATPEEPAGHTLKGTFQRLDYTELFAWRGTFGEGDLVAFVTRRPCADTMVDRDYPYSISISLPDGSVLLGCCDSSSNPSAESWSESQIESSAEPLLEEDETLIEEIDADLAGLPIAVLDEKPPGDWSKRLFDLLPAIESCLAETPGASARVVKAWSTNDQRVGVRTVNSQTAGFECVATRQGSVVQPLTPLKGHAIGLHDGWSPIFTPRSRRPPAGECYQHERIVGASGELIGWLSYDTC
jgi:uncharacterized membrane protein